MIGIIIGATISDGTGPVTRTISGTETACGSIEATETVTDTVRGSIGVIAMGTATASGVAIVTTTGMTARGATGAGTVNYREQYGGGLSSPPPYSCAGGRVLAVVGAQDAIEIGMVVL